MKKIYISLAFLLTICSSCATLFTGTSDTINFESNPPGAKVYIDGVAVCTTPCSTRVSRSLDTKEAELRLQGYEVEVFVLDQTFNPISILNLGNLLGWGIDLASGALVKYDRKGYVIDLRQSGSFSANDAVKINVDTESKKVSFFVPEASIKR